MCTLHAPCDVKLNCTLDERPATASLHSATPKRKMSLASLYFRGGDFLLNMERTFFFLVFCLPSIQAVWRGEENSVTPRFSRSSALTSPRIFHSCFVCAGFLFWNGARGEGGFPLRRKLTEFNAVTESSSRFLPFSGNGSFGGI